MCVRRLHGIRVALTALLIVSAAACGGAPSSPVVSPSLRGVPEELEIGKRALLTAADLGPPWMAAKDDSKTSVAKKPDEFCPGQPGIFTIAPPRTKASTRLTAGANPGAAIGSFQVATLHVGLEQAWRDAVTTVLEGCATYRQADGLYVTATKLAEAPALKGADEVIGFIERIHQDIGHKKLLYVRQYLYSRSGRVLSLTQYAAVQPKRDPTGSDLTDVTKLADQQREKATAAFGLK